MRRRPIIFLIAAALLTLGCRAEKPPVMLIGIARARATSKPVSHWGPVARDGSGWIAVIEPRDAASLAFANLQPFFNSEFPTSFNIDRVRALSDSDHRCDFALSRPDRALTRSDIDPRSLAVANDGTIWLGDAVGPFLLHFDASGKLLDRPIRIPGTRGPRNPFLATSDSETKPTLADGRGIGGLALSSDGTRLFVFLDGPLVSERDPHRLRVREYSLLGLMWVGSYDYRLDADAHDGQTISGASAIDDDRLLVIERDDREGNAASSRRAYVIDLSRRNRDGSVPKRLAADLLHVADPRRLTDPSALYRMGSRRVSNAGVIDAMRFAVTSDNDLAILRVDPALDAPRMP